MFTWHDLLYLIALLIGVLLVAGHALGLADLGADASSAGAAIDLDAESGGLGEDGLLDLLGIGRVPLAVLALASSLLFGGSGLALGPVCRALFGPSLGPWLGLGLATTGALLGTAAVARLLTRYLPLSENYAGVKRHLLGLAGRVIVCGPTGDAIVAVIDDGGAEMRIRALIEGGRVSAGARVAISGYDASRDLFRASELLEHGSEDFLPIESTITKERERGQ